MEWEDIGHLPPLTEDQYDYYDRLLGDYYDTHGEQDNESERIPRARLSDGV